MPLDEVAELVGHTVGVSVFTANDLARISFRVGRAVNVATDKNHALRGSGDSRRRGDVLFRYELDLDETLLEAVCLQRQRHARKENNHN